MKEEVTGFVEPNEKGQYHNFCEHTNETPKDKQNKETANNACGTH